MASNYPQPNRNHFWTVGILVAAIAGLCGVIALLLLRGGSEAQKEKAASPVAAPREDAYLNELRADIIMLRETMPAYIEGVPEYEAGLVQLEDGKMQLAAGQLELNKGYADYAAGKQQLDADEAEYAAGLKEYNEGVALIEANTQRYNEGKAQLAQIEPLMPYADAYVNFRNGVVDSLPGIDGTSYHNAQEWYTSIVLPLGPTLGVSLPSNVEDFPAAMQQQIADAKAKLKEYEDGLAKLEAGKAQLEAGRAQLDAGHAEYNNGVAQLNDGAAKLAAGEHQLADGKAQLDLFESGEDEMVRAILKLIATPEVANLLTKDVYLGSSFNPDDPEASLWQKDENGNFIILNGHKLIELNACEKVIAAAQEYVDSYEGEGSPWD